MLCGTASRWHMEDIGCSGVLVEGHWINSIRNKEIRESVMDGCIVIGLQPYWIGFDGV